MRKIDEPVGRLIRAANPVSVDVPVDSEHHQASLTQRAEDDLAAIMSASASVAGVSLAGETVGFEPRASGWHPASRRIGFGVIAAAVSVTLIVALGPTLRRVSEYAPQHTAPTPMALTYQLTAGSSRSPAKQLRQIAVRAARLRDDTGSGKFARVSTQSWSLFTRVSGNAATSAVVPAQDVQWTAADGSGRSVDTTAGHRSTQSSFGSSSLMWPLGSLAADDATLARQLQHGHPVSNGPAERLVAIHDAYLEMPLRPAVRAAMLRYLAATPSLTYSGEATDRAGRNALAFSVESSYAGLPTRYTLLIDAGTGRLLDYEETLTQTAGKLGVKIPAVISYTLFMSASYTDQTS